MLSLKWCELVKKMQGTTFKDLDICQRMVAFVKVTFNDLDLLFQGHKFEIVISGKQ